SGADHPGRTAGARSDRGRRALGRLGSLGKGRSMTITILVLPPPALWAEIVTPGAEAKLAGLGEVDRNLGDGNLTREEVLARVAGADAVLTSWGAPIFHAALLARAPRLRIIAHA